MASDAKAAIVGGDGAGGAPDSVLVCEAPAAESKKKFVNALDVVVGRYGELDCDAFKAAKEWTNFSKVNGHSRRGIYRVADDRYDEQFTLQLMQKDEPKEPWRVVRILPKMGKFEVTNTYWRISRLNGPYGVHIHSRFSTEAELARLLECWVDGTKVWGSTDNRHSI